MPLVEQELFTLQEHMSSPLFYWGSCYSIFSCMCIFCRSLSALFFFFWPLCYLSFDLRILITLLVSSNSSHNNAVSTVICDDHIISLRGQVWSRKTSSTSPLFMEAAVPCQERDQSYICVSGVSILPLYIMIFLMDFWEVKHNHYSTNIITFCNM